MGAPRDPEHARAIKLAHSILADESRDIDSEAAILARQFLRAQSLLDLPVVQHASALMSALETLAGVMETLEVIEAVAGVLQAARDAGRYSPPSREKIAAARRTIRQVKQGK